MAHRRSLSAYQATAGLELSLGRIDQWCCHPGLCDLDILRCIDQSLRRGGPSSWSTYRANFRRDGLSFPVPFLASSTAWRKPYPDRVSCQTCSTLRPRQSHTQASPPPRHTDSNRLGGPCGLKLTPVPPRPVPTATGSEPTCWSFLA